MPKKVVHPASTPGTLAAIVAEAHEPRGEAMSIAVIDDRTLLRECFAISIEVVSEQTSVFCFSTVDEWRAAASRHPAVCLVLLCRSGSNMASSDQEIESLVKSSEIPII